MTEKHTRNQETSIKPYSKMHSGAIIAMLAIAAILLYRVPDTKRDAEYAAIEKQAGARRNSLIQEQDQALIEHQIRCAAALDAYRRTQIGILDTYFASDQDRDIAIDALRFSYVKHRKDLDDKYNNTRDSLNNLYRRETSRLDEAHKRIYGKSK